ncbi:hypothetical protein AURDEDRAFT_158255 [Auricularia subglabra TFB-10046 SS5]|nr:hypothetical protein AURDEDRAFT_158255 [Auricularia subglabra TFB-10046 SS5]
MSPAILFNSQGQLICPCCNGLTVELVSKTARNLGKIFYKCDVQPRKECETYFIGWKSDVDEARDKLNSTPVEPPTTATEDETGPASVSVPTPRSGVRAGSQSAPTRTRSRPEIGASPVVTPQRHLSHPNVLETVPAAAPTAAKLMPAPGAVPSQTELADHEFGSEDGVLSHLTDDDFEGIDLVRIPPRTSANKVYPALPASTQGSTSAAHNSPTKGRRERMPGTFTSSTESSSGRAAFAATGRIQDWATRVHSPQVVPDDVFSAAPTQDMAPSVAGTVPTTVASSAARMHGLNRTPSSSQSQGTVHISEPSTPVRVSVPSALVHPKMLDLTEKMQDVGRDFMAVEHTATTLADRIKYIEAQNQALLEDRAAMQDQVRALEMRLAAAHKRIEALEGEKRVGWR